MSVGVVIGIYGDMDVWSPLAVQARDSLANQTNWPDSVRIFHGETLAQARNGGVVATDTDWVIILDADDRLDNGYIHAMTHGPSADIRWPSTQGTLGGVRLGEPSCAEPRSSLAEANWITIGAMFRRDLFLEVGGFNEYPVLEDWDLWLRMANAGATTAPCPEAIYLIPTDEDSDRPRRNNQPPEVHAEVTRQIRASLP